MKKTSSSRGKNIKSAKKEKGTKKKEVDNKAKQKEKDYQRLEEYLNESGLSLAFNIIFAELISKQILPENFFTYTSMRLTQIGKEIEGLKTKEAIYVDDTEEQQNAENQNEEKPPEENEQQPPQEEKIFMTSPQQNQKVQAQDTKSQKSNLKKK